MLFECKKCGGDLNINHAGQLFRYFHVTAARFGVLTNGLRYQFFTDLEHPNKMDDKPFFEFDILDFKERDVEELKKFAKSMFDVGSILNTASDLKYARVIQNRLGEWLAQPPEEFVKLVSGDLIPSGKRFTPALLEQFSKLTKRAFEQFLNSRINERLQGAMAAEAPQTPAVEPLQSPSDNSQIVTTEEEIEGLHIVRSILRDVVNPRRIVMRDNQSYCAILLDDNNRKPVCRLRFNNTQKLAIGIFDLNKDEQRFSLQHIDDLYNYAEQLKSTIATYRGPNDQGPANAGDLHNGE
jgi:hypothetical protein